jgi:glucosamine-phosphate N-acetyltransferase
MWEIRTVQSDDLKNGLIELLGELSTVDLEFGQSRLSVYDKRAKDQNLTTWVVADYNDSIEKKVIGTISLFILQKFTHRGGKVGLIEDLVVNRDYRGKGIGSLLVKFAVDWAKSNGCYKVILNSSEENANFYSKLGFYEDQLCMRLDLLEERN